MCSKMPLKGIKVLELAGLAPGPYCGMVLADFGASVIRVDKTGQRRMYPDFLGNGKKSIALNLKSPEGIKILKKLSDQSDVLIDPFRKGIMEKMGIGPNDLMKTNSKLIYARLTGYGQQGSYANMAGHDINYLGLSGVLSLLGRHSEKPTPPLNLAADFGGGGLMCALGIILALFERSKSNLGQVIDANMVEGSAYLASWLFRSQNAPILWGKPRGKNLLDTGYHFYDTYETKDNQYMCVGAIEPKFYNIFVEKLGLTDDELPQFHDVEKSRAKLEEIFKQKTRDEWCAIFDGLDACVSPVLTVQEAPSHVHNKEVGTFTTSDDNIVIPNPAPRLSRTPGVSVGTRANPVSGEHTWEILDELHYTAREIRNLESNGIVEQGEKNSKL